jgi:hypothetical protein
MFDGEDEIFIESPNISHKVSSNAKLLTGKEYTVGSMK